MQSFLNKDDIYHQQQIIVPLLLEIADVILKIAGKKF